MASSVLELVSGSGAFDEEGLSQFVSTNGIDTSGVAYTTVAICGPQVSLGISCTRAPTQGAAPTFTNNSRLCGACRARERAPCSTMW